MPFFLPLASVVQAQGYELRWEGQLEALAVGQARSVHYCPYLLLRFGWK